MELTIYKEENILPLILSRVPMELTIYMVYFVKRTL